MLRAALTKEEFDKLEDGTKSLYAEVDGLFMLQVEAVTMKEGNVNRTFALEDTAGIRSALSKERANVEMLTGQLKRFADLTEEPHVYLDAFNRVKEFGDAKNLDEKVAAQVAAVKSQLESNFVGEINKLKTENQALAIAKEKAVKAHGESYRDAEARRAFAHHEVLPEWQDVMLDKVRAVTRVKTGEDGTFATEVMDGDGNIRLTNATGSTEKMDVLELVGTLKNISSFAVCFKGTNAQGSGAPSSTGQRGAYRGDLTKLTGPQLMEIGRKDLHK